VPSDSIYHGTIALVDVLLIGSAPFDLIDLLRTPLYRFLAASLARYPLARIADVARLPSELWLHWTMPWRVAGQPVAMWDAFIQSQLSFYSALLENVRGCADFHL
jgi:hypothetical protein